MLMIVEHYLIFAIYNSQIKSVRLKWLSRVKKEEETLGYSEWPDVQFIILNLFYDEYTSSRAWCVAADGLRSRRCTIYTTLLLSIDALSINIGNNYA